MRRIFEGKFLALAYCLAFLIPTVATAQVAWVKTYDEALKQASREKKFVVLDMSASW